MLFIAHVQIVTVEREEDYALILKRRWPRLMMIILQDSGVFCSVSQPNIRIIYKGAAAEGHSHADISILRPLHSLVTDLPFTHLAAQQLAHQMRISWPLMSFFMMSPMHDLDGLGLQIVSQLVHGTWTRLVHLGLAECEIRSEGFLLLSQGKWPCLTFMDVSGNCLDAEGMSLLARGNWPRLATINLSSSPKLDAVAVAHLSVANWFAQNLTIAGTPFSANMVATLLVAHESSASSVPDKPVLHASATCYI